MRNISTPVSKVSIVLKQSLLKIPKFTVSSDTQGRLLRTSPQQGSLSPFSCSFILWGWWWNRLDFSGLAASHPSSSFVSNTCDLYWTACQFLQWPSHGPDISNILRVPSQFKLHCPSSMQWPLRAFSQALWLGLILPGLRTLAQAPMGPPTPYIFHICKVGSTAWDAACACGAQLW